MRELAPRERRMHHPRQHQIGDIGALAQQQPPVLAARDRAPDIAGRRGRAHRSRPRWHIRPPHARCPRSRCSGRARPPCPSGSPPRSCRGGGGPGRARSSACPACRTRIAARGAWRTAAAGGAGSRHPPAPRWWRSRRRPPGPRTSGRSANRLAVRPAPCRRRRCRARSRHGYRSAPASRAGSRSAAGGARPRRSALLAVDRDGHASSASLMRSLPPGPARSAARAGPSLRRAGGDRPRSHARRRAGRRRRRRPWAAASIAAASRRRRRAGSPRPRGTGPAPGPMPQAAKSAHRSPGRPRARSARRRRRARNRRRGG